MKILIFQLAVILIFPTVLFAEQTVYIAGLEKTKSGYDKMVAEKGGDPFKIDDYDSDYASRPVISLLTIVQALRAGGLNDFRIEFKVYPNLSRSISELKKGKAHILATDIWEIQFDDSVYKTAPFIRKGEFEKGIYMVAGSPLLKSALDVKELLKLKPITGLAWKLDIQILKMMGFKRIETSPTYNLLFKMLSKGRADFALLEFSRGASPHYWHDEALYPVPKTKIVFPYSRHFMVSRINPDGYKIYSILEKGLKKMRNDGTIDKALQQSGIICKEVKNWKTIWPEQTFCQ